MQILQIGCFGDDNLGDEISAAEIRRQLRLRFPDAGLTFTMVTRNAAHSERTHPDVAAFVEEDRLARAADLVRSHSLVVVGGGTLLGPRIMRSARFFLAAPGAHEANLFAWGCGVEPIAPGARPHDLLRFAALARVITVRNESCRSYLLNAGISDVVVTADVAFSVPVLQHRPARIAAVNLSEGLRRLPRREVFALLDGLGAALSAYHAATSCRLRYLPMRVEAPRGWRSDMDWGAALNRRLGGRALLEVVPDNRADTVLEALAQADLLVATRYHACLLAATTGCRVVGIGASDKMHQLFDELGIPDQLLSPREAGDGARVEGLLSSARAADGERLRSLRLRAERTVSLVDAGRVEL